MRYLFLTFILLSNSLIAAQAPVRLVVLAPDITRNLLALGARDNIVGIIANAALEAELPQAKVVGDHQLLSIEAILGLRPDYVVAWQGGNPPAQLQRLSELGLQLIHIKTERLSDLPAQWQLFGELLGREEVAGELVERFESSIEAFRIANQRPVPTFYQLWHEPLMSINNQGWFGEILQLCGAQNILGDAYAAYPQVGIEAVVAARVELILASDELPASWRERWQNWPQLPAVAADHLYTVEADYLHQLTMETLKGVSQVCSAVERAR